MTRTVTVTFSDQTRGDAPAAWVGKHCAVHRPAGANRDFPPSRGQWTVTHIGSGMAAAVLRCTRDKAISLARAWDERIGTIDPADARSWPHRQAWANAVQLVSDTLLTLPADGDGSQDMALTLAHRAGLPIDTANCRIKWRGQWWDAPTDAQLDWWTFDSVCESPAGATIEPDHPESWLRLLRLI